MSQKMLAELRETVKNSKEPVSEFAKQAKMSIMTMENALDEHHKPIHLTLRKIENLMKGDWYKEQVRRINWNKTMAGKNKVEARNQAFVESGKPWYYNGKHMPIRPRVTVEIGSKPCYGFGVGRV